MTDPDRSYHIMVIDDELNLRVGCERILTRMGHEVSLAGNGEEALSLMSQHPAQIVLLDLKMPGLSGMEVLDRIMTLYPSTLVIIVTGFATIESAIEAMKKGAHDFLTKPFQPEQLRFLVKRAGEHITLLEERNRLSAEMAKGLWTISTEKGRLKTVVNSMNRGLLITELDGRMVMSNPAFLRLTGLGARDIEGTTLRDHAELVFLSEMLDELRSEPMDGVREVRRELAITGEHPVYLLAGVKGVSSEDGEIIGCVAVVEDITLFKEQEKEKTAFMAMLTHELRSPLCAVEVQCHAILQGLTGELSNNTRQMLTRVKERIRNVLSTINELLDLSKLETGQFVGEKVPTDLNALMQEAAEVVSPQIAEKRHSLTMSFMPGLPLVMMDPKAIKQVITNLLSNAIRYTPDGGRLELSTGRTDEWIYLRVKDNGLGIPAEYRSMIFDRFFRIKDERVLQIVGTGLGLSIVKAIVEAHEGRVIVDSEPGRGSLFEVWLPQAMEES